MYRNVAAALTFTALALSAPARADVSYNLSLQIPVMCSILQAYSANPEEGVITVLTSCNAENYSLVLGGDLADYEVLNSINTNGSSTLGAMGVNIHAARPGLSLTTIKVNGDLRSVNDARLTINAY